MENENLELVNYSKNYFTKEEHDFTHVFDTVKLNEDEGIQKTKRELEKLHREVVKKENQLREEVSEFQKTNYTPVSEKIVIEYNGSNNYALFDLSSGLNCCKEEGMFIYSVSKKSGYVEVIVGYNFELGGFIVKKYSYSINKECTLLKTKPISEIFISFFENKRVEYNFEKEELEEFDDRKAGIWSLGCNNVLNSKDRGFINGFYGVDYKGEKDVDGLIRSYRNNASFEIILKTAPQEIMEDLLNKDVENAIPIHKIIGVTKETYENALERNLIIDLYRTSYYIPRLGKSEKEFLDFLEEVKMQEDELDFYKISFGDTYYYRYAMGQGELAKVLINYYLRNDEVRKNYSIGKYADYVIRETINQGYTSIRTFIEELEDYLDMCKADGIKPTLYSSYLKQTHDITQRNHDIMVEEESETIFGNRYSDFKTMAIDNYFVVAPKESNDLKQEGDNLNHCVASYIKKVIDGKCLIYFLRTDVEKSLITFEVAENKIVQARGMHNRRPTDEEYGVLKKFAEKKKLEVRV